MSDDEPREDGPEGAGGSGDLGGEELERDSLDGDDGDDDYEGVDELDVRDALRKALRVSAPDAVKITRGVQDRIRVRSEGRYFADGWSTSAAPHATYLVTTVLMLLLVLAAWWFLGPQGYTVP